MKGSVLDLPIIAIILLGGCLAVIVGFMVFSNIEANWPEAAGVQSAYVINKAVSTYTLFDQVFLMGAMGLCIFSIISAFYVNSHPVFFIFSMIGLGVVILINAVISNVFWEFVNSPAISTYANSFPFMVTLMKNLPLISGIVGILIAVATHGKPGSGGI
jgi:hypothetical protein